jgi:hypothetical protein
MECKTQSPVSREEHRLEKIFGPKKEEVKGA